MESLVDDEVGEDTFRTRLGNDVCYFTPSREPVHPAPVENANEPVTLLNGTR